MNPLNMDAVVLDDVGIVKLHTSEMEVQAYENVASGARSLCNR